MNKEQVKGTAKEVAGQAQKNVGKAVGSADQQAKGHAKEIEGKAEKKAGDLKQGVKDVTRKP